MSTTASFTLKSEFEDQNFGGSVAYGENRETLVIHDALEEGGGVITTDDPALISALNDYPALKKVSDKVAEEAQQQVTAQQEADEQAQQAQEAQKREARKVYVEQKVPDLEEEIERRNKSGRNIEVPESALKDDLINLLMADDEEGQS